MYSDGVFGYVWWCLAKITSGLVLFDQLGSPPANEVSCVCV